MSEFLYDIKIYQVQKISDKDIIAYQIELFTLNDPDVVYLYNYPMNFSSDTQDPHSLVIDVVDLIRHPLKTVVESKKGKLQKTLTNRGFKKHSGLWRPTMAMMSDHQRGTKTIWRFTKREINKGLPDSHFTVKAMERG